jgi:hypothetical protein
MHVDGWLYRFMNGWGKQMAADGWMKSFRM